MGFYCIAMEFVTSLGKASLRAANETWKARYQIRLFFHLGNVYNAEI